MARGSMYIKTRYKIKYGLPRNPVDRGYAQWAESTYGEM